MPTFLFRAKLASEGVAGVLAEGGSARREAVSEAITTLGGTLEAFYFAFGDEDVIILAELPDSETAAGFAMETTSSGRVAVSTTVLLTAEQVDRAREKKSGWRSPGG